MKTLTFLAILALVTPALADHRHSSSRGYSGHRHGGSSSVRISYGQPYYGYRSSSYRSYPYRVYPYRSYPSYYSSGVYFRPAISLMYSSSPRYVSGYSRTYRSTPAYYDDSASLEVDVQRALKSRGFYRGSVDGDIGPGSRAAIRSWQYENGLEPTGRIDSALLRSLGL